MKKEYAEEKDLKDIIIMYNTLRKKTKKNCTKRKKNL